MGSERQRHLPKVALPVSVHAPVGIQGGLTPEMSWGVQISETVGKFQGWGEQI